MASHAEPNAGRAPTWRVWCWTWVAGGGFDVFIAGKKVGRGAGRWAWI